MWIFDLSYNPNIPAGLNAYFGERNNQQVAIETLFIRDLHAVGLYVGDSQWTVLTSSKSLPETGWG